MFLMVVVMQVMAMVAVAMLLTVAVMLRMTRSGSGWDLVNTQYHKDVTIKISTRALGRRPVCRGLFLGVSSRAEVGLPGPSCPGLAQPPEQLAPDHGPYTRGTSVGGL